MTRYLWRVLIFKVILLGLSSLPVTVCFPTSAWVPKAVSALSLCFVSPYSLYLLSVSLILVVVVYHLSLLSYRSGELNF